MADRHDAVSKEAFDTARNSSFAGTAATCLSRGRTNVDCMDRSHCVWCSTEPFPMRYVRISEPPLAFCYGACVALLNST